MSNLTLEKVQALITRAPYHQWLGLKVVARARRRHRADRDLARGMGGQSRAPLHPWRHSRGAGRSRRRLGDGGKTGRGVPTIDLRVDYHAAAMPGDLTVKGKIVRMGGQFSTAEARIYDARRQAAGERPRHLFHRAAAAEGVSAADGSGFNNLGDLIVRDRDLSKVAIIDLGGEEAPREFTYAELDAHGEWRRARADQARPRARRPRRDPVGQSRRISRGLFRHHARGLRRGAGEFQVSAQDHPFHHPATAGAKLVFCDAQRRARLPAGPAGAWCSAARATMASKASSIPGPFNAVVPDAERAGDVPLHVGLDRHAEGRRALASEPYLGGGDAARAGLDRHRYLIAAPLYHMNALALSPSSPAPRTPPSCCCRSSRRAPISTRSSAIAHLADRGAADDRDDAARGASARARPISPASSSSAWARRRSAQA